jgi:tetratricopeptide (TPR) repeat protein
MRSFLFGIAALAILAAAALANGLSDANAGMDALKHSDYDTAVRLFTQAIASGELSPADIELAYVKRAQAYIGQKHNDLALADLDQAQKLDPNDKDIVVLRAKAQGVSQNQGSGPALEETLNYIVKKVAAQGVVRYSLSLEEPDAFLGPNYDMKKYAIEITNLRTNPAACRIDYHKKLSDEVSFFGNVIQDNDVWIEFKGLKSVTMLPAEKFHKFERGWRITEVDPPVRILEAKFEDTHFDRILLYFTDEDAAPRVAKAMIHAAELCGAKREPF